ncbi:MAG: MarR family transcriptional regulator [Reichenbachiella sp.]
MGIKEEIKQTKPLRTSGEELILSLVKTVDLLKTGFDSLLKEHDLTLAQFNILRICRGAQGEGRTCSDITERMLTKVPDVTRLLDRMVKKGLVKRERCTSDRRIVWIFITDSGLDVINKVVPIVEHFTDIITGQISEQDITQSIQTINALRTNIKAHGQQAKT